MGTFVVGQESAVGVVHGHMEAITVAVSHQDVSFRSDIDAVGETDVILVANLGYESTGTIIGADRVALEVADVKEVVGHHHVRRLLHVLLAGETEANFPALVHHDARRVHAVHHHNLHKQKKRTTHPYESLSTNLQKHLTRNSFTTHQS